MMAVSAIGPAFRDCFLSKTITVLDQSELEKIWSSFSFRYTLASPIAFPDRTDFLNRILRTEGM